MLQFLPLIMNLLSSKKKDQDAINQNSAAAMLGQAPTAQGGDPGSAIGSMLQKKGPDSEPPGAYGSMPQQKHSNAMNSMGGPKDWQGGKLSGSTNKMLDEGLGGEPDPEESDED